MTTHEIRHHGRLIEHMTDDDAHAYVEHQMKHAALDNDERAQARYRKAWDVRPRRPIELYVLGNLVDTFDDPNDAIAARQAILDKLAPTVGSVPESTHAMVDARPTPTLDTSSPKVTTNPKTHKREIVFETVLNPETNMPLMRVVKVLKETPLKATEEQEAVVIIDRSAAARLVGNPTQSRRA